MPKNIFNSLKRYVDRAKSNARSAAMRASYVDTRSDTTRKGYHEGRTRYGYNYGANENGITGTIARVIDGKDYNPYLQTGVAPMPDKIASPKDIARIYKSVKNLSKITPKQWTALQDAAIARGDIAEAQRLRDLHNSFTPTATFGKYYRGTKIKRNSYPDRHIDEEVGEMNGIYLTKKPKYAKTYGDVEEFYLHSNNPLHTEGSWTGIIDDATRAKIEDAGYDAVVNNRFDTGFLNRLLKNSRDETITFNGKNIKSADAVTYDDNGVRIPLGERDNFNVNDIRWSWLLPVLGAGTATAVNAKNKNKSKLRLGGIYSLY